MKVKDAIKYLKEYKDQDQEIMIAWNDMEHFIANGNEDLEGDNSADIWEEAVIYFEKWGGEGFGDECREAISAARERIEEESER